MNNLLKKAGLLALPALLLCTTSAHAAVDSAALENRIKELEAKIGKLEKALDSQDKKISAVSSAAPKTKVGAKDDEIEITLAPVPKFKSKDGSFSFQPIGRVHADAAVFSDDKADHSDGTMIRRGRLGFKGHMYDNWEYKTEVDFANNETSITDMYLGYTGFDDTLLQVGQFKESFGMDQLTSSNHINFIERSSVDIFSPARHIGLAASRFGNNWSATAGLFGDTAGTTSTDDEAKDFTGRVTYAPVNEKGRVVHVGVAGSHRTPDNATDSIKFESRPETRLTSIKSVGTGTLTGVDNVLLTGLEGAAQYDAFTFQSELVNAKVNREGNPDADFRGWYAQGSYALTGEKKSYSVQDGAFKRISPAVPFNPSEGTYGAWEVAARYSSLDLNDGTVTGGEMDNVTLGLNWYPNANVRFMANYIIVNTDENATVADDSPEVAAVRAQFDF